MLSAMKIMNREGIERMNVGAVLGGVVREAS